MSDYAQVIIDISSEALDRPFTYFIPEELRALSAPGVLVKVPFGRANREVKGYIAGLTDEPPQDAVQIKAVTAVLTGEETTLSRLIAMAAWMKDTYGSTMIQALKTVLPVKARVARSEKKRVVRLAGEEEIKDLIRELSDTRYKGRLRALSGLAGAESLDYAEAVRDWGMTPSVLKFLEEKGIAKVMIGSLEDTPAEDTEPAPELTPEQARSVRLITSEWGWDDHDGRTQDVGPAAAHNGRTQDVEPAAVQRQAQKRPVLLMGVTGSGKTMVYMELIDQILSKGKQAIILIPEISLTYQTVGRFKKRFGQQVSFIHSRLSQGEKYEQFLMAKQGKIRVMVGPRSALFTPFTNLGLIIIDEEHEPSYKSEASPRYHAREAALYRAGQEGAFVLLGSATPSVESYYRAVKGEYALIRLPSRFGERPMAKSCIIDMRQELREGNRSPLSRFLIRELERCLEDGTQAMLFLNRRGYAGFISCRNCGYVVKCPHCDVSLTQHSGGRMICHYCGYETGMVRACPECGSEWIGGFKAGTQQIEEGVRKRFPQARILRMDYDTTRRKGSYEAILSSFAQQEADILVGTQMIVKGHDFPKVTLVGILAADLSLGNASYQSAERTFQLVCQAAGRAGRGIAAGTAVIQTYQPEHYSLTAASDQDYEAFYSEEIGYRTLMEYPPVSGLMAVLGSGPDQEHLKTAMHYLRLYIQRLDQAGAAKVIGPAPAAVGKVKDVYHMILYVKHEKRSVLAKLRDRLDRYIESNEGFRGLRIQYDMQ